MRYRAILLLFAKVSVALQLSSNRNQRFQLKSLTENEINSYSSISSEFKRLNESNISKYILKLRGGSSDNGLESVVSSISSKIASTLSSSDGLFNALFLVLASSSVAVKLSQINKKDDSDKKPVPVRSLQLRFLIVFWLLRMADWLQGPYFYEVYSSKMINGLPVSLDMVSKLFLVGFATTGIFGPFIGRLVDSQGRKLGTLAYVLLYSLGALSTKSSQLSTLLLGRIAGGLGTSLLFSAPEAWLVGEHNKEGFEGKWLGETFGWAYAGDALVAIAAGYIASISAASNGPVGPFLTSIGFLIAGGLLALFTWKENTGRKVAEVESTSESPKRNAITEAVKVMVKDPRILLVGTIQALFEGAMYIFVLQWPPLLKMAISQTTWLADTAVPYGKIFSCFMACCLLGSSSFNLLQSRGVSVETTALGMLSLATISMGIATLQGGSMALLTAAFFLFEVCVGLYFPSIGLLRSKHLPDEHRSVMMNLFGLPLNLIVVSVFLSIKFLGVSGALAIATTALAIATACIATLRNINKNKVNEQ